MTQMQQMKFEVGFLTPAFLGNAEQAGQWRTPPFKALLRQWWRVVVAPDLNYRYDEIRRKEAHIFGHAWLEGDRNANGERVHARKSRIRLRLDRWTAGKETKAVWGERDKHPQKIKHPEVRQPIGPLLYLGYGPLETKKVSRPGGHGSDYVTVLKKNAAIQAGERAVLSIAASAEHMPHIRTAFVLMNEYGTLGGRSRNGWGSIILPVPEGIVAGSEMPRFFRRWREALGLDWPHALGQDSQQRPLVWQTEKAYSHWKDVMRDLAGCKVKLRTQFKFSNQRPPHQMPQPRHWLSYPVTKHPVKSWKNRRLPNSLRFKVRQDADGKLRGVIFHMPCLPPKDFRPDKSAIEKVWKQVHSFLDSNSNIERINW